MEGVTVPRVYILPRGADADLVQSALLGLSITPISCAIISDVNDSKLAHEFSETVVRMANEQDAIEFAFAAFERTQMPSVVFTNSPMILAIHEDGRLEEMKWPVHDSTAN
jgi:hypothetical protein